MTGNGSFLSSNQGLVLAFLQPPDKRPPIEAVGGELTGKLSSIPGSFAFLRPLPVLQISTGATNQNQGQYAFTLSGVNPDQVYDASTKLMGKLATYPGFATISSDFFNNTPSVNVEIRRDEAKRERAEGDATALVVICDDLFETVTGAPCGGPAEDQEVPPGGRFGSAVDRWEAAPGRWISIYLSNEQ